MKFKHGTRRRALEYEKEWVKTWKDNKTFEKSVENRPKDDSYVFYDGPPFISGSPHHGTLLSSIVKDAVPRYQTMKGKRVERVWGWDCHGLPAERYSEKKLGLKSRQDVLDFGLEKYIVSTRDYMSQTAADWEDVVDRVGRWVDFKGAYKTMDKNYMESIWWAFKTLYEKGKIYEGEKVLMYCTLDGTPLSKAEVTMDAGAYQDVTDPSVFVEFKLKNGQSAAPKLKNDAKVLFVCNANVGRSQFAQGFYNHLTGSTRAVSAGVHPDKGWSEHPRLVDRVNGLSAKFADFISPIDVMQEVGVDVSGQGRMLLTEELLGGYDLVVNLAERSQTPAWLRGENVVWWDVPDPTAEGSGELLRKARDAIKERINELVSGVIKDDDIDAKYLLAWTTTPWTLPANTALAVNPELTYVEVKLDGERLVVAKDLAEKVFVDEKHKPLSYKVVREFPGTELVGLEYEPLLGENRGENAHKVWAADYVSSEDGTGIVHIAPAYGEEDFELARREKIPVVHTIDQNGFFTEGDWQGQNVWEINKQIAKDLKERGIVWKIDYIRHSYPHCHRCGTKLMYRAHPSWFVNIDGQREEMLEKNQPINWFPAHLKHGRFAKTIEQAPDWNISRDRFWATAMPVWKSESGKVRVVGSYAELKEISGVELDDYHRPWIDDVTFTIDGEKYTRIDKVMDSWFEAGSMPFAQFHYPFENKDKFEANFPGDFIVEYIAQTRAWFYYMHAVNIALFDTFSFKNVITTGTLAGNDGRKMSKSYGNFTDPNELMDKFSADSLRFLLLSSPVLNGEDFALHDKDVGDVARKLSMIWNMYDFFTMYAEVDNFTFPYDTSLSDAFLLRGISNTAQSGIPDASSRPGTEKSFAVEVDIEKLKNPLDKWIVSRVHELNQHITKHMDDYNIPEAMSDILPFIEDASNWYVRRSRRRFWKSEDDGDKAEAYRTLHYVLLKLAVLLAPFTPFLAEELYQKLGGGNESVHLLDWPSNYTVDQLVLDEMNTVRDYVNRALSIRAKERIKIRQPLASVTVPTLGQFVNFEDILTEELNVKKVTQGDELALNLKITPELRREGLMREVIRHVQAARKDAGLNVDDRIMLSLQTEAHGDLQKTLAEFSDTIAEETLATTIVQARYSYETTATIEGDTLTISLQKA